MPHWNHALTALLALPLASCVVLESPLDRHVELAYRIGTATLDDDYEPVAGEDTTLDEAGTTGLEVRVGASDSGLRYVFGGSYTKGEDDVPILGDDFEFDSEILELSAGARYEWTPSSVAVRPYVGAGVSYVTGSIESDSAGVDDDDEDVGIWGQVGLGVPLGDNFTVELDYRMLFGPEFGDLAGADRDGVYDALSLGLAWRF